MDVGNKLLLGTAIFVFSIAITLFAFTEVSVAEEQGFVSNQPFTINDQGGKDYKVTIYDGVSSSEKISP